MRPTIILNTHMDTVGTEGMTIPPFDPLVRDANEAPVPIRILPAWFDAAHLAMVLGKPVLGIGSGTPGTAHGSKEYALLEHLHLGARAIALSLHRLLVRCT